MLIIQNCFEMHGQQNIKYKMDYFLCVIIRAAPSSLIPPEVNEIKFKLKVANSINKVTSDFITSRKWVQKFDSAGRWVGGVDT